MNNQIPSPSGAHNVVRVEKGWKNIQISELQYHKNGRGEREKDRY